jgi:hypothetical protein
MIHSLVPQTFIFLALLKLVFGEGTGPVQALMSPAMARQVVFDKEIRPILQNKCIRCHGRGKARGGFRIDNRETILEGGNNGAAVEVGNSTGSYLVRLISGSDPDAVMPPEGEPLKPEQVSLIRAWIDQGLAWEPGFSLGRFKEASLVPRKPTIPTIPSSGLINPIDRFIAAYLEGQNIDLRNSVSDLIFAKRVYLDTIGLLPTPEQLDSFLKSDSPVKREQLVDRLLADKRGYAENWMTFWNDALRNDFAGTGYIDGGRTQITEWLYRSLEANTSYDQFVAGLIHPTTQAEGFIRGIVWRGVVNSSQTAEMQAAQNVSQVFMGINLKCASCHDSFISNWKLEDAYNLASVFAEKPLGVYRCDTPAGTTATARFLYSELGELPADASREQRLARLAEVITSDGNGRLTRTIVNRLWARFMGRGLVEPVDEMDNEPWNTDLLDWLACDLAEHDYDLKRTIRLILTSMTYQLPSVSLDLQNTASYRFTGPVVRRMTAEQFRDALAAVTDVWPATSAAGYHLPPDPDGRPRIRAWLLTADALTTSMGRPNREQVVTQRPTLATTLQALELTNGQTISDLLKQGAGNLMAQASGPGALAEKIFRTALGRDPSTREKELSLEMTGDPVAEEGVQDLLWAVAMLPEFQVIY